MGDDFTLDLTCNQIRDFLQGDDDAEELLVNALDNLQGAALTREAGKASLLITCTKGENS